MHTEQANHYRVEQSNDLRTGQTDDMRELSTAEVDGVSGGFGLLLAAVVIGAIYVYDAYQIYKATK